jgi:hypothetical protein
MDPEGHTDCVWETGHDDVGMVKGTLSDPSSVKT